MMEARRESKKKERRREDAAALKLSFVFCPLCQQSMLPILAPFHSPYYCQKVANKIGRKVIVMFKNRKN